MSLDQALKNFEITHPRVELTLAKRWSADLQRRGMFWEAEIHLDKDCRATAASPAAALNKAMDLVTLRKGE